MAPTRVLPVAVHYTNIVEAFLAERPMSNESALVYLEEVARQGSQYVPVRFLLRASEITLGEAMVALEGVGRMYAATAKQLVRHLRGEILVSPNGKVDAELPELPIGAEEALQLFERAGSTEARSLALGALLKRPDLLTAFANSDNRLRLLEAVTHLSAATLGACRKQLYEALLQMLLEAFDSMKSVDRTAFRKAVFHLDRLVVVKR